MASVDGDSAALLASRTATPIAQLTPDLPDQALRVVRGQVTITWPYNSVTKTLAFLLAEPDVRLRRDKGQIRIQLHGPSAKAASECGLGAGDELLFSLDGADWAKDVSPGRIPGARVEWQLQFNRKLVLQVKSAESGEIKQLTIDNPSPEQPDGPTAEVTAPRSATPEPEPIIPEIPSAVRKLSDFATNEYPSPAFVKRARISYGALFEGGFDIFEEDGGVKGKGRKRTRFGRDSSAWRYTSQSPSPEPTSPAPDGMKEDVPEEATPQPSPKPQMTDEACQTVEVDMTETALEPVDASSRQRETTPSAFETPTPASRSAPAQKDHASSPQSKPVSSPVTTRDEQGPVTGKQQAATTQTDSVSVTDAAAVGQSQEQSPKTSAEKEDAPEQPTTTISQPSPPQASNAPSVPSTLFGPKSFASTFSSFGSDAPARVESTLSLADQVRFGFSHVPQTTNSPSPSKPEPAPEPDHHKQDAYPVSYLDDAPAPTKYADMDTYLNAADEQDELAVHGQTMPPEPPAMERFNDGEWEMSTQSPHYNLVEGGHFGTDALDEGARLTEEQASLHTGSTAPDKVPEGFASYGREDISKEHLESPAPETRMRIDQVLVENEDTDSGDEVGVEDEEDEDEALDEYSYGERIEEGDYDQRNYDIVSDDEEGLSEEDEEIELEAEERYGNGEMYEEDGEGEEWDEEEDYDSEGDYEEEEDYDMEGYSSRRPAAPAPTGEPVVISLLSDSEDEDEPAPAPRKPTATTQAAHAPEPPAGSELTSSPEPEGPPRVLETIEGDSEKEEVSKNLFGGIQVVDFATRATSGLSQNLSAPVAETDTETGPSPFASEATSSFQTSSARDESYVPAFEPAPSEGSSEGLFVTQPQARPAPSESSSEGLFISQPRHRSLDAEDKRPGGVSSDAAQDADEVLAHEKEESEQNEPETRDEPMKIEQEKLQEESMRDIDSFSFSSQIEMDEEVTESSEHPATDDVPSKTDATATAAESTLEVEEIALSEEDVDMIDAGPVQFESASPESSPQGTSREQPAIVSELAVTEVVSEVTTTVTANESLPDVPVPAPQEAGIPPSSANDRELAVSELQPKMPEGTPGDQLETPTMSTETQELASQTDGPSVAVPQPDVDSFAQKADQLAGDDRLAQTKPAELQPEPDESVSAGKFLNGTLEVSKEEMETVNETREHDRIPDSSPAAQAPTVVRLDETVAASQPIMLSSQPEKDEQEQAVDEAERSQQRQERETAQQPTTPAAEELDDEVMLLEQLTQEQQQSFESQAAEEASTRTRSPSPDLSISLARQAVAAKRNKKAPEPVRTSPRVTRARSSSLRSNATNGTPERDTDNSVSLARAALASPSSKRAAAATAEVDGTSNNTTSNNHTVATLKSDLTKRLRTELKECVPLKSLRMYLDKEPHAIAVVTSKPTQPTRAKGGPREYFMSFHVTDPSVAPAAVVEVQLYRPHKDSLPVVKAGDVVLLQKFRVAALSGKGFGLRTGGESAWAVWDAVAGGSEGGDGGAGAGAAPQIRGPPVEDWQGYVPYVGTLREWFGLVMADAMAKGKLEKADRKLNEAGGGGGGGGK